MTRREQRRFNRRRWRDLRGTHERWWSEGKWEAPRPGYWAVARKEIRDNRGPLW